jgi:NADPH2:quinone reductase
MMLVIGGIALKAIQITQTGGPEVLTLAELPIPTPSSGQVLIKIAAAGINFIEIYYREGRYKAPLPLIPGTEASGTVVQLGSGVEGFAVGDAVATTGALGSYAEYALVPVAQLVKVPAGVDLKLAAAVMLQGMTAHYLTLSTWVLVPGETALVHAAAGGIGLLLTQMARACGAHVIATVSTPEKAELARAAGANEVILYTEVDFETETRRITEGRGVDVVYDSVGKATFEKSLNCLRPRGLLALFGGSSGAVPPFDPMQLAAKGSLFVTRPTLKDYIATRAELEERANAVLNWVAEGKLKLHAEHTYPLAEAAQAHIDIASRKTTGKLLLIP